MPKKTYPPAIRQSQRIQNQNEGSSLALQNPEQASEIERSELGPEFQTKADNIQVQDHDPSSDSDSYYNADPSRQLIEEMASEENNRGDQPLTELELLRQRIAELEAEQENRAQRHGSLEMGRFGRETTVDTSAFGGSNFRATGMAAWPVFEMFDGENGANPKYDKAEKARADSPPKFSGDKTLFDNWLQQVSDKFEEDMATYRSERSRMMALNKWLAGRAARSIETRYSSKTRPFSCLAEMIQVLESQYHDPTQASAARDSLQEHEFELGQGSDIHDFIAEFNSLAQKAKIPEADWKITLWEHILSDLDSRLLEDSENPDISYETFCDRIAKAVYSKQRLYEKRQKKLKPKRNDLNQTRDKGRTHGQSTGNRENKPKTTISGRPKTSIITGKLLSETDKMAHLKAGTCFNCGTKGHLSAECPTKNPVAGMATDLTDDEDQSNDESGKE